MEASSGVVFFDREGAQQRAFEELLEQAAKIGANGVIDWETGERSEIVPQIDPNTGITTYRPQVVKTVKGTAIYVVPVSVSDDGGAK